MTRVCAQQLDPVVGDLDGNRRLALDAIAEGVDAGAEVIVLPELVTSGYMFESAEEAAAVGDRARPRDPARVGRRRPPARRDHRRGLRRAR